MTTHQIYFKNSKNMTDVRDCSVDMIITSPPYPMIKMWDDVFFDADPEIKNQFENKNYLLTFELMHKELNKVWNECNRVLKDGGMICINIGDATRTLNKNFQLWNNHSIINEYFIKNLKLNSLPIILWRKVSNKPNKFMGSGMLPPNAYITLEHEYILIFRKGNKRKFEDNTKRYESAFFWEERNIWFSDIWFDIKGIKQFINNSKIREKSAAFPFDLVSRLINMFSVYGDIILDPFSGTGTTILASMHLNRNSIGYEIEKEFKNIFDESLCDFKSISNAINKKRLQKHLDFINLRQEQPKHKNENYNFSVITSQEKKIKLYNIDEIIYNDQKINVKYISFNKK